MYKIKEIPISERPRERLINEGAKALTNDELLAIVMRTGTKKLSAIELAQKILYQLENLTDLKYLTYEMLSSISGIKEAKAATIIAAIELGHRISTITINKKHKITSPYDVYNLLHLDLIYLKQEHFIVLYLNIKSELIKKETLYIGTINQMVIHPRDIYQRAILLSAAAMIFVHNHPTGDATPSNADIKSTNQLFKSAEIMGIDIVDHIIIGNNEYYSLKANQKTVV